MMAEPSMPERRPSPGLTLELSSNNPFRNRAGSPAFPSPALNTPTSAGSRPMSRNPFLSTFEAEFNKEASNSNNLIDMSASMKESPKKATFGTSTEELFNNLTFDDSTPKDRQPRPPRGPPSRSGPPPSGGPNGHRPSRSDEEERRMRGPPRGPPRPRGPPGSRPPHQNSPERRENRRPRRNSESSMADKGSLDPEEERKRRERRKRREEGSKDSKDPKSRSGRVRRPHGLDIIDKLDVSGIYGPSLIHHDGPYDAVQPHRNRKKDHRAPMQAFPMGSANNTLGGSGPVNKHIDLDRIHGRGAEGFTDFSAGASEFKRPDSEGQVVSFNPKAADVLHGEESAGLGTSTFLDGAPASRHAIQRRESENQSSVADGGLGRKKSIAQRIRGISQPRRGYGENNPRIMSPDARYGGGSPGSPLQVQSAGGISKSNERNPFFDDYDTAYDKKGAAIKVAESREGPAVPAKSPGSPPGASRAPLTRAVTTDSFEPPPEPKPQPTGFLGRMKSLKGGRRPRPERPAA